MNLSATPWLTSKTASLSDAVMCAMMNGFQWRLRNQAVTREAFEAYLDQCRSFTRDTFYRPPPMEEFLQTQTIWRWKTPIPSGFRENDRIQVEVFPSPSGPTAPSMLIFHALMSASAQGYRRLARYFNTLGWNAYILHLPYHYTRRPAGYFNGELAITADLVRIGETLRQGVTEARQLMAYLRTQGSRQFGAWATSFGGWIASLLSSVESDFSLLTFMQPIVDVDHAVWENPASVTLRRLLKQRNIPRDRLAQHAHLSSPIHGRPLGNPEVYVFGGKYDTVSPSTHLKPLTSLWSRTTFIEVPQGHFGYAVTKKAIEITTPLLN